MPTFRAGDRVLLLVVTTHEKVTDQARAAEEMSESVNLCLPDIVVDAVYIRGREPDVRVLGVYRP
jgi:hypothetical protein